jgi:hypothetical protein
MRESNGLPGASPLRAVSSGNVLTGSVSLSPAIHQSLETIHEFVNSFPPQDMEQHCWELLYAAFNSPYSDSWQAGERSAMLYFYRQLCQLAPALSVVDKELHPIIAPTPKSLTKKSAKPISPPHFFLSLETGFFLMIIPFLLSSSVLSISIQVGSSI